MYVCCTAGMRRVCFVFLCVIGFTAFRPDFDVCIFSDSFLQASVQERVPYSSYIKFCIYCVYPTNYQMYQPFPERFEPHFSTHCSGLASCTDSHMFEDKPWAYSLGTTSPCSDSLKSKLANGVSIQY